MEQMPGAPLGKAVLATAVAVVCFAVIYSRVLHPIMFSNNLSHPSQHPHIKNKPAERACGEKATCGERPEQPPMYPNVAPPGLGKEKGLWTSLLPFYSIGIVSFLVYTLAKMILKDKSSVDEGRQRKHQNVREPYGCLGKMSNNELSQLREQLMHTEATMLKLLNGIENGHFNDAANNKFQDVVTTLKELTDKTAKRLLENDDSRLTEELNAKVAVNELDEALNRMQMFQTASTHKSKHDDE